MAVSTTNAVSGPYNANGATTVFPFTFTAPSTTEVAVITRDTDGADTTINPSLYAVSLDGSGGGSITFDTAPASGLKVLIYLDPSFTQEIEFENGSAWLAEPVNEGNDRAALRDQALKRDIDRAIKVPIGEAAGILLPTAEERAGQYLAFDAEGDPAPASGTGADTALRTDLAAETGGALVAFKQSGAGAVSRSMQAKLRDTVNVKDFGALGDGATNDTAAILAAITAVRGASFALSTDGLGSGAITAYTSGTVHFAPGTYVISPDLIEITQDLGLTLRGAGSRRTNNSVRGATVLLITGTSSGYGIRVKGNASRGLTIEDLDICYATSGFTGDILDNYGSPGLTLRRVMLGTNGISGGTRLQTARSCLRSTYDEFQHCVDTTFDGAVDGWWSDDTRGSVGEFGGAQTKFTNCVWYDFTGVHAKHAGNRNRPGLSFDTCSFNPISVAPVRCIDLNNVDNLELPVTTFQASTSYAATTEWMRLVNCGGTLHATRFGDLAKCGTIGGMLDIKGCFLGGTDGLTLTLGVITSQGNEVSQGTAGFSIVTTGPLSARLGPDLFKSDVTRSYDINADSSNLDVHIIYAAAADSATSKFRNVSARVTISNNDEKCFDISTTPYSPGREDTGRTIRSTNAGAAVFTLPAIGTPGLKYTFVNDGGDTLEVRGPSAGTLFVGSGAAKVSALAASGNVGASITFKSFGSSGYHAVAVTGSWSYS